MSGFTTDQIELFDITVPASPIRISGATVEPGGQVYTLTFQQTSTGEHHYLAMSPSQRRTPLQIEHDAAADLRSTYLGADYIIIAHGDFLGAGQTLADYRASQGMRTIAVDVQDIYDEFNDGLLDPEAIHSFLAYAYTNWEAPAPSYVLLMGDGNYDFKNNYGFGEPNYVPPYLANVDYWMGEAAADNRYVCVSGEDVLPDMHLGRLAVKTAAEANDAIAKILNYEQNPPDGNWNQQVLFAADNPDSAGNFYAYSDTIADDYLPAPYMAQKVYYGQTYATAVETRAAIIDAFNGGRLLVNYVGHGSVQDWASERLFRVSDIPAPRRRAALNSFSAGGSPCLTSARSLATRRNWARPVVSAGALLCSIERRNPPTGR